MKDIISAKRFITEMPELLQNEDRILYELEEVKVLSSV
jgi:hypothetical protein